MGCCLCTYVSSTHVEMRVYACVYKIYTARGTAGIYARGWAVRCSISSRNPLLHVYLCAKSPWCSSIKVAAHVERPPQSLAAKRQLSIISPCYEEGCFAGIVGYCTAQDGRTSVETHIFPHFPAAANDPVYLLSARCLLLFCMGLGSRFCSGLGKWSFDLQMRKEEGSRSEAE